MDHLVCAGPPAALRRPQSCNCRDGWRKNRSIIAGLFLRHITVTTAMNRLLQPRPQEQNMLTVCIYLGLILNAKKKKRKEKFSFGHGNRGLKVQMEGFALYCHLTCARIRMNLYVQKDIGNSKGGCQ